MRIYGEWMGMDGNLLKSMRIYMIIYKIFKIYEIYEIYENL